MMAIHRAESDQQTCQCAHQAGLSGADESDRYLIGPDIRRLKTDPTIPNKFPVWVAAFQSLWLQVAQVVHDPFTQLNEFRISIEKHEILISDGIALRFWTENE